METLQIAVSTGHQSQGDQPHVENHSSADFRILRTRKSVWSGWDWNRWKLLWGMSRAKGRRTGNRRKDCYASWQQLLCERTGADYPATSGVCFGYLKRSIQDLWLSREFWLQEAFIVRIHHDKNEFAAGTNHINEIENFRSIAKIRLTQFRGIHKPSFHLITWYPKGCKSRIESSQRRNPATAVGNLLRRNSQIVY